MSKTKPLPQRFPDSHSTARIKIWRPTTVMEAEGPYDEVASDLLCMVAAIAQPKGKDLKAMRECLAVLKRARR